MNNNPTLNNIRNYRMYSTYLFNVLCQVTRNFTILQQSFFVECFMVEITIFHESEVMDGLVYNVQNKYENELFIMALLQLKFMNIRVIIVCKNMKVSSFYHELNNVFPPRHNRPFYVPIHAHGTFQHPSVGPVFAFLYSLLNGFEEDDKWYVVQPYYISTKVKKTTSRYSGFLMETRCEGNVPTLKEIKIKIKFVNHEVDITVTRYFRNSFDIVLQSPYHHCLAFVTSVWWTGQIVR